MPWGSHSGHKHAVAHCPAQPQVSGRELRLGHGRQSQEYWQMHWDFDIWQGVGRGLALVAAPLCRAPHVHSHMPIPAGQQLPKPCLSLGVCPRASYLMLQSLDFLITEMAVRAQRAWGVGLSLGASRATVGTKPIVGDPWKIFPAQEATHPICDPQTIPQPVSTFLPIGGIE